MVLSPVYTIAGADMRCVYACCLDSALLPGLTRELLSLHSTACIIPLNLGLLKERALQEKAM